MVAGTLDRIPTLGSTIPRIYTPPLPENCDRSITAEHWCDCGCGLNEKTSWGWSCIEFLERYWHWTLLPWQKWLYFHALEKRKNGTGFRYQTVVVLVGRQQGKELDVDTHILTENRGWTTMADLVPGDRVYHPQGHSVEIIAAHETLHDRDCYRVTTTDGRSIVADAEHLWTIQDRRNRKRKGRRGERPTVSYPWETVTTEQLRERGLLRSSGVRSDGRHHNDYALRLPQQHCIESKPRELPIDPYLLGVWLGDGHSKSADITCGALDLAELTQNLTDVGTQIVSVRPSRNSFVLHISIGARIRDGFESRCRQLGIWQNKHLPESYLTAGTQQRQALLAGLLDADGYCSRADGQVEFCSVNKALASGVLSLVRSLGYRATLREGRATLNGRDCGSKYRVRFTPSDPVFRLGRKNARIQAGRGDRSAISIAAIEPVESRPVRCITVDSPDGLYLAGRDLVPTHNSRWIKGIGLWRLFMNEYGLPGPYCPAARLAVISAQNLDYAETMLAEVVDEIRESELFSRELINHRVVNGGHRAILTNRRYWRAATATTKGARSLSVDLAMLDELRTHTTWDAYNAIAPTTTSRPYSQVICTSNAGDAKSEVLRSLRDGAIKRITTSDTGSTRTFLGEWSVPQDVDPRDPRYWHLALPAMGYLNEFSIDTITGFFEAMQYKNMPGFRTEFLCQFVDSLDPGILPVEQWQGGMDAGSRRAEGADVYAALDVNYDRSHAYIAVCAKRADGYLHIEVVQAARGTDWVIPWLSERKGKFVGVAVQKTGAPASVLIPDMQAAGIPVVEWGPGAELTRGCGIFYDKIVQGEVYHRPSLVLDRAAASTIARRVGDAWMFDRRNSPIDAAPLVACAAAVWLQETYVTPGVPTVHVWPDEDTIAQWEREAEEGWGDV